VNPDSRPVLLVSEGLEASARAVWENREAFGSDPEVHVFSRERKALTSGGAALVVPWAQGGLDYTGTFFDALSEGRISMVLPLLEHNDGTVQGLLEFAGVPYAGCGITGLILARDPEYCSAVLGSLGLERASDTEAPGTHVAVLGNGDLVTGTQGAPGAEVLARRVFRGLGLGGWALVEAVFEEGVFRWRSIQVQPDLGPGAPFLEALAARNLDLAAVLTRVLRWGQDRHAAEAGLKNHFKDKI